MPKETLTGAVERMTYYQDASASGVLRLRPDVQQRLDLDGDDDVVTVIGTMPELEPGVRVLFEGEWIDDPDYGRRFQATQARVLDQTMTRQTSLSLTETVAGRVARVTFFNEENGYAVIRITPNEMHPEASGGDGSITVVGTMPRLNVGVEIRCEGAWILNPQYGRQFKADNVTIEASFNMDSKPDAPVLRFNNPDVDTRNGEVLSGTIERITFYNTENGWSVIKIVPKGNYPEALAADGTVAVVGIMPELDEGESAEFTGRWVDNAQYGRQFKAEMVIPIAPDSEKGIIAYIADTVYGIGNRTAQRIYDHFGDETLSILDDDPQRIHDVPGLKPNLARNLIESWTEGRAQRQVMVHLQSYGITSRLAHKLFELYGQNTVTVVRTDPYQLADDIQGIGFKKADGIARALGLPVDSPARLRAGLVYALRQLANDGHTYAPTPMLIETAGQLLSVTDPEALDLQLKEQILGGHLRADVLHSEAGQTGAVYLPVFYHSEQGASQRLRDIAHSPSQMLAQMRKTEWDSYLGELARNNDVSLSATQQSAVSGVMQSKVSVLTGGPGTGKTTTLQMVIHAMEQENYSFALASPTGRAAKRLAEATQRTAQTIHRLLGFNTEGGFDYNEDSPMDVDLVIIDEASMLDLVLFYNLLKALRPETHLMLVGDVDQLPSVGAGNVLRDVIDSGIAHVTRLTQIFRQDDESQIVINAHRINNGEMPFTDNSSKDFFFFNFSEPQSAADMIVDIVHKRLPQRFGVDPMTEIQVIAPMYRGLVGVNAINDALQAALNSGRHLAEKRLGGRTYRKNDKVMQTRNNYEKEVFNGDIGIIHAIDDDENLIQVMIDGRVVEYDYFEAEEQLIHAYCISTHRSQGSEYPVVVMPLLTQHYVMLQRNLLYTAITRARRMVVLVGDRRAIRMAVQNNKVADRYSGLSLRLRG